MIRYITMMTFLLICMFHLPCFSQVLAMKISDEAKVPAKTSELTIKEEMAFDGAFLMDSETKTFFIDFEKLPFNLRQISLKSAGGEVVKLSQVFQLPVDAIFEMDLQGLEKGEYTLEIQSFANRYSKKISVE